MGLIFIVVAYDVKDDKRRNRVLKTLRNYGQHIQYSVFECDLDDKHYLKLRQKLLKIIDLEEDSIRFYFLCEKDAKKIECCGGVQPLPKDVIII